MTVVSKHAANLAAQGMSYWAPGPVTGTLWALHSDSASPVLVNAQYEIVGSEAGTPAQHKAAMRGLELNVAVRAPGSAPVYGRSGGYVVGISYPLPEHQHFYRSNWREDGHTECHAAGACSVFVPYDRNADVNVSHIPATVVPVVEPVKATRTYRRRVAA